MIRVKQGKQILLLQYLVITNFLKEIIRPEHNLLYLLHMCTISPPNEGLNGDVNEETSVEYEVRSTQ